jgi:hypothetical protein
MMIGLIGSEDEEDAVEDDLDDDIDSMYNVADGGDHGKPENADDEHSETGESTDEKTIFFSREGLYWSRTPPNFTGAGHLPTLLKQDTSQLYWSRTPPKVARARRENIILRLPGCVDEAKNANTPHDAFSLFISDDILNIILRHINQKNS